MNISSHSLYSGMEDWESPPMYRSVEDKTIFTLVSFSNDSKPGGLHNIAHFYSPSLGMCYGCSRERLCTPVNSKRKLNV